MRGCFQVGAVHVVERSGYDRIGADSRPEIEGRPEKFGPLLENRVELLEALGEAFLKVTDWFRVSVFTEVFDVEEEGCVLSDEVLMLEGKMAVGGFGNVDSVVEELLGAGWRDAPSPGRRFLSDGPSKPFVGLGVRRDVADPVQETTDNLSNVVLIGLE